MALYVSFPVVIVYTFNKSLLNTDADWLINKRKELFPENPNAREHIRQFIKDHQDRIDKKWEEECDLNENR